MITLPIGILEMRERHIDETRARLYRGLVDECRPPGGWDYRELKALEIATESIARAAVNWLAGGDVYPDALARELWNWLGEHQAKQKNLTWCAIKTARAVVRGN